MHTEFNIQLVQKFKRHEHLYVTFYCKCYLVVMVKTPNTITNENSNCRKLDVVNPNHASYRANELKVLFIINIYDLDDRPKDVFNIFSGRVSRYKSEQHTVRYIVN